MKKLFFVYLTLGFMALWACKHDADIGISAKKNSTGVYYIKGPRNITAWLVPDCGTDDQGCYYVRWDSVWQATAYDVFGVNISRLDTVFRTNVSATGLTTYTTSFQNNYTDDSIRFTVKPTIAPNPLIQLANPNGLTSRSIARPRGGITVVIVERTTGTTPLPPNKPLLADLDSNYMSIPFIQAFFPSVVSSAFVNNLDSLNSVNSLLTNKLYNNARSSTKLIVTVKDLNSGAPLYNTFNGDILLTQADDEQMLRRFIVNTLAQMGMTDPYSNIDAVVDKIEFRKN